MGLTLILSDGSVVSRDISTAGPPATVVLAPVQIATPLLPPWDRRRTTVSCPAAVHTWRVVLRMRLASRVTNHDSNAAPAPMEILSALQHGDSSEDVAVYILGRASSVSSLDEVIACYL
jgi:hypothetical protein